MNNKAKISIIVVICIAVLAAVIIPVALKWDAITGTIKNETYYSYEDIKSSYDKGYADGSLDLNQFKSQLDLLKTQLDEKTKAINGLTDKINALQAEKKELQNTIANKDNEIGNRDELLIEKDQQITSLSEQIKNLNITISELKAKVEEYSILLEAYSEYVNKTYVLTFYNQDGSVLKGVVVDKQTMLKEVELPTAPIVEGYVFKGWSLRAEDKILEDFNSKTEIVKNTKYYAVYNKVYNITLVSNSEIYQQNQVEEMNELKLPTTLPNLGDFIFKGWVESKNYSVNSDNSILKNSDYVADSDKTFIAVYGLENGTYQCGDLFIEVKNFYFSDKASSEVLNEKIRLYSNGNVVIPSIEKVEMTDMNTLSIKVSSLGLLDYFLTFENDIFYLQSYSHTAAGRGQDPWGGKMPFIKIN